LCIDDGIFFDPRLGRLFEEVGRVERLLDRRRGLCGILPTDLKPPRIARIMAVRRL